MEQNSIGMRINDIYLIKKRMGGGAFGDVYQAEEIHGNSKIRDVAVKIFKTENISDYNPDSFFKDVYPAGIIENIEDFNDRKHFIQILTYGKTIINNCKKYFIVMELIQDGVTLEAIIKENNRKDFFLSVEYFENILKQLFKGLSIIHNLNIIHKDIKPDNLLLCGKILKIGDFGVSVRHFGNGLKQNDFGGTITYMAPETCLGNSCFQSDIYSAGLTLYELWINHHPFADKIKYEENKDNSYNLYKAREEFLYQSRNEFNERAEQSDRIERILKKCLAINLAERYKTADDVLKDICAPVFNWQIDFNNAVAAYSAKDYKKAILLLKSIKIDSKIKISYNDQFNIFELLGLSNIALNNTDEALDNLLKADFLDEEQKLLYKEKRRKK